ncbi:MAG: matrixin family metalloprotease, partial [Bacteroidetes bacterium]|nr:matrixin family metalloprotease [Bacteroidota bacterium]
MRKVIKFVLSLVVATFYMSSAFSLIVVLPLENRLKESPYIVEGKVISVRCFWDMQRTHIMTDNVIEVYKDFRGNLRKKTIHLITLGGILDNQYHFVDPELKLSEGDIGVFLLKKSVLAGESGQIDNFETVFNIQSFLRYNKPQGKIEDHYQNLPFTSDFYFVIEKITLTHYKKLSKINMFQYGQEGEGKIALPTYSITGFSPSSIRAGTNDTLSVFGQGFGLSRGAYTNGIYFMDADIPTYFNISTSTIHTVWSDTLIKVIVPSTIFTAGSGKIGLVINGGQMILSQNVLDVRFSHTNIRSAPYTFQTQLVKENNNNGLSFKLNQVFDTNIDARLIFMKALDNWRCRTSLNLVFDGMTSLVSTSNDATNLICFGSLETGVLGMTNMYFAGCGSGLSKKWYLYGFDIKFNNSTNWNYTALLPGTNQIDFESVALHELGHAQLLEHVIQTGDVMKYAIGYGQKRSVLMNYNLEGGDFVMDKSNLFNFCSQLPMLDFNPLLSIPEIFPVDPNPICHGDTITLCTSYGDSYLWNTGETTRILNTSIPGEYSATVTNQCSTQQTDTVTVTNFGYNPISLGNDTILTYGDTLILDAGTGYESYLWSTGSSNQTFNVTIPGLYWVRVIDTNGCSQVDTIIVTSTEPLNQITINTVESDICPGESTSISFTATEFFYPNNVFVAQLSLSNGSFSNPVTIGTLPGTGSGTMNVVIPVNTPQGNGYRIRINSTAPPVEGIPNNNNITINPLLPVSVSITQNPPGSVCSSSTITFNSTVSNGGTSPVYQWKVNNLNVGTNQSSFSSNSLQNGDIVTCQLTSNLPCTLQAPINSNAITMSVIPAALVSVSITASPSSSICSGQSVTFNAIVVNGGTNPVYVWKKNGIIVSNSASYSSSSLANNDVITCRVTSNAFCATGNPAVSNSITMTVNTIVPVSVSISANPPGVVCSGTEVTFSANILNGGSNPVYAWKKNNLTVGTGQTYNTSNLSSGDLINCLITSSLNCVVSNPAISNTLTMNILPSYNVSVSIEATPDGMICSGTQVNFLATPVNGGSQPSFKWFKNSLPVGLGSTYQDNNLYDEDLVYCQLTSSMTGCITGNPTSSGLYIASVNPTPVIFLGNDTTIPLGNSLLLNPGLGYFSYQWSNGETGSAITVTTTGNYAVTVTDQEGCTASDSILVTVGYNSLQGIVSYFNSNQTLMDSTHVLLKQGNNAIYETTTNDAGYYFFENIGQGNYMLSASPTKLWGGANSTDALITMKHYVGITLLTGLKMAAANVDNSPVINTIDALMIAKRSVGMISSFPIGNWVSDKIPISANGQGLINQNLNVLCAGDVNGSFIPLAKTSPSLSLVSEGQITRIPDHEFIAPLLLKEPSDIGSISLFLSLSSDLVKVNKVISPFPGEILYNQVGNEVRISWYSLVPAQVPREGELLSLWLEIY